MKDEQREEILTVDDIMIIANDYNDLWRYGAISDKDHEQVEDLIVSHTALLSSEQTWKEEALKQRELNDVLANDNMNAELNLQHINGLLEQAIEVLEWIRDAGTDYQSNHKASEFLSTLSQEGDKP